MGDLDRNRSNDEGPIEWAPIDFVLKQGDAEELGEMRQQISDDPMRALDLADTVQLIEEFRQLRTEASASFAGKLADVADRAERRLTMRGQRRSERTARDRVLPFVTLLAAAATFSLLWWTDPLERRRDETGQRSVAVAAIEEPESGDGLSSNEPIRKSVAEWHNTLEAIGNRLALERSPRLRKAFEEGLRDMSDPLSQWLDPRNALVLLRLDHELRANAKVRTDALRRRGGLPAVDRRVQELADGIADDLLAVDLHNAKLEPLAYGMRALIAAGSSPSRVRAMRRTGDWLAERLPELHGSQLVAALSGLTELAAISGQHFEEVARHGSRLVAEVLMPDEETWSRRRPELLGGRVQADLLGEAARIVARLPGFGVDVEHCRLVRSLVLGQLREQRDLGQDRPEVLAAMLYGCADLLQHRDDGSEQASSTSRERDRLQYAVRRWNLARLAPDYVTVQQIAWSLAPGDRGYARLQRQLRELAVQPIPAGLEARAAFCLCLATNYAGFVGGLVAAPEPRGS